MHRSDEFKIGLNEGLAIAIAVLARRLKDVPGFDFEQFQQDLSFVEQTTEETMVENRAGQSILNSMIASYQMHGVRLALEACKGGGISFMPLKKLEDHEHPPTTV